MKARSESTPVRSPYPALQALLPRLATIGTNSEKAPVFDDYTDAEAYREKLNTDEKVYIIPVWAINHTDLTSSEVVNWTFTRWLH